MIDAKKRRYKPIYKKFINLKVNPKNNNKILKLKRNKWQNFLNLLKRNSTFYKKFKPYNNYHYKTSKFASSGNSFKKKFRNDLIDKKIFNYYYGGILRKYLKKRIPNIYNSKTFSKSSFEFTKLFESRLDSVLYRSKFCYSIKNARQLITHKHIKVNNRIEKNKSYILKQGDLIQINPKSYNIIKMNLEKQFKKTTKIIIKKKIKNLPDFLWPLPPNYLTINYKTQEIIFGNLKNYNFSTNFPFKLNINSIITNYYIH